MANSSQRSLAVEAGLYALRYLGSAESRNAPTAHVAAARGSEDDVTFVAAPGCPAGTLEAPGGSLVVVVGRRGTLDITIEAVPGSSNLDARFSLDLLASAAPARRAPLEVVGTRRLDGDERGERRGSVALKIKAHVSRRGDVEVEPEEWVAGPQAPGAIEGVSFECEGSDVGIATQFVESRDRGRWSGWVPPGDFAGSRQKASPLLGLRLKLVGDDRAAFRIDAEALFLGSPIDSQSGQDVELIAPGGNDPLVGLKVRLSAAVPKPDVTVAASKPRVRVFR